MKSSKILLTLLSLSLIVLCSSNFQAQTWNSNAGGYNGGYGQVYGSWGLAFATKNMDDFMKRTMQQTMMRNAMEKRWGKKAVAEAEAKTRRSSPVSNNTQADNSGSTAPKIPVVNNYAVFKPEASDETGQLFADSLGSTAEEKELLKRIYTTTKTAFEREVAAKGWKNNIAAALTFFIVTSSTVYHDTPEPSEETAATLFAAVNQSIDEIPEFSRMPNKVKQEFYNKMIGFSGLLLAGYTEGKQTGNAQTIKDYGKLAGILTEMVLKMSPENIRFEDGQMTFKQG